MTLSRLTPAPLRDYWPNEATDFTRWLAQPENIELLGDAVGVDIDVIATEASVGRFNVDIHAREANTDHTIIIENQLELTDHGHMGQLMTYAAGMDARYVIWVVRNSREEHRQAIDWLNEHTDDRVHFFLIAIELWRIGESPAAPRFRVICRPNEWQRTIRDVTQGREMSETDGERLTFWQDFYDYAAARYPSMKLQAPAPRHFFVISIGRSDCHVALGFLVREERIRCALWIPASKETFDTLRANREAIESELAFDAPLAWIDEPKRKARVIAVTRPFNLREADADERLATIAWLANAAARFRDVFRRDWPQSGAGPDAPSI